MALFIQGIQPWLDAVAQTQPLVIAVTHTQQWTPENHDHKMLSSTLVHACKTIPSLHNRKKSIQEPLLLGMLSLSLCQLMFRHCISYNNCAASVRLFTQLLHR